MDYKFFRDYEQTKEEIYILQDQVEALIKKVGELERFMDSLKRGIEQ